MWATRPLQPGGTCGHLELIVGIVVLIVGIVVLIVGIDTIGRILFRKNPDAAIGRDHVYPLLA